MKTLPLILVAAIGFLVGTVVLAGCDRSMDDINPEPIADNNYSPATAYPPLMRSKGTPPVPEAGEDTTSGGTDTIVEQDAAEAEVDVEVFECTGSEGYCTCLAEKGNKLMYDEYCLCMDAPSVPGGQKEIYCPCCTYGDDPSFPEYAEDGWEHLYADTCLPHNYTSPCQID